MRETQHLCAFALPITADLGRAAIVKTMHKNFLRPADLHWRMHPAQVASVSNLYEAVAVQAVKSLEEIDAVRHLAKDFIPSTFLGIAIEQSADIPESHIELLDADGFVLARITDLSIPIAMFHG